MPDYATTVQGQKGDSTLPCKVESKRRGGMRCILAGSMRC